MRIGERCSNNAGRTGTPEWVFMMVLLCVLLLSPVQTERAGAATRFADTAFDTNWQGGEVIVPNFWGPLANAREGQRETYAEAPGGMRLVQYFDKARMELRADNTVTNGLLATELITGRLQLGDNTFETRPPAAVPMAGDADNPGPTYAHVQALAAQLLVPVSPSVNEPTIAALTPTGTAIRFQGGANFPLATVGVYDQTTGHNIPAAFAMFRARAGLLSIGLAISEPFWSNVRVGGVSKDVLIQAFERRVLTYTPSNAANFQVEFGNIGQQYYQWRYGSGSMTAPSAPPAPSSTVAAPPATAIPAASATAVATIATMPTVGTTGAACDAPARVIFNNPPANLKRTVATTLTATVYDAAGAVCGNGTRVIIGDTGTTTTFAGGGKAPNGAAYVQVTVTNGVATATITSNTMTTSIGPVSVNVYRITASSDPPMGSFGVSLVNPSYAPAVLP